MALSNFFVDSISPSATVPVTSYTTDSGHNWVKVLGAATPIASTSFDGVIGGGAELSLLRSSVMAPSADNAVTVPFYGFSSAIVRHGIAVRLAADGASGYLAAYTMATSKWGIYRIGAGASLTLIAEADATSIYLNTHTVVFSATTVGNAVNFTLTFDGVAAVTGASDTAAERITAPGYVGLWADRTGKPSDDGVFPQSITAQSEPAVLAAPTVSAPVIVGTPVVGTPVSYTPGTATGYPTPVITQQWTLDGVDIAGATGATYTPVSGDIGHALRVRQIATNSEGSANAISAPVTVQAADTAAPTFVSGTTNVAGTEITLTFSEPLGSTLPAVGAFHNADYAFTGVVINGATVTLTGAAPVILGGGSLSMSYNQPASNGLRDPAGNLVASFFTLAIANTVPVKPTLSGYTLKTYGDDPSHDFHDEAALNTYINGLNLGSGTGPVMVWCYKGINLSDRQFGPASSDDSNFVTMTPAPGLGYAELEADDAPLQYGTVGLELTITSSASIRMGMELSGWRVRQTATASNAYGVLKFRRDGNQPGTVNRFHHCRMLVQHGSQACESGEYNGIVDDHDNLYIADAANGKPFMINARQYRNTYVRLNGAAGYQAINNAADNCLFYNCGGDPMGGNGAGNFTNTAQTTTRPGLTTVSGNFFVSATNYRPAAGSPMIGGATASAVSTIDNNGNNRGTAPDAGAAQLVAALPLPVGTVTFQEVKGQKLTIRGTTANAPASALASLVPAATPEGAAATSPVAVTLTTNAFEVVFTGVIPGNYAAPVLTFSNAGGTTQATGAYAFTVLGITGTPMAAFGANAPAEPPPVNNSAPTVSISTALANIMTGKTATVSGAVDVQGDATGTLTVFADPQPSGTPIALGTANVVNGVWTKQVVMGRGQWKLRAVATANAQTATASTGTFRVQGITPTTFTLPGA